MGLPGDLTWVQTGREDVGRQVRTGCCCSVCAEEESAERSCCGEARPSSMSPSLTPRKSSLLHPLPSSSTGSHTSRGPHSKHTTAFCLIVGLHPSVAKLLELRGGSLTSVPQYPQHRANTYHWHLMNTPGVSVMAA